MSKINNKVIAGLTAAILGLAVVGGTGAAVADEAHTVGSLTIHKIAKTVSNGNENDIGTGKEATVAGDTINGVEFTVKRVNEVDLTKNEGWKKAAEVVKGDHDATDTLPAGYTFVTGEDVKTATTANGGVAKISDLPLGLYQVSETKTPAGVQAAHNFWVTIPMSDPVNKGQFMYNVHVYPKNTQYQLEKTVVDKDTKAVGEDVVYTLSTAISTQPTSSYVLQDQLDAAKLTFKSAEVKLGETVLAQGADADYTLTSDNNLVKVELTKKGRDAVVTHANSNVKINKKNAEKSESEKIPLDKLVLNITATVKATGEINNTGKLLVDNGKVDITSNEVSSKFGAVKIMKKDSATQAGIPGVKFEVYASHTNDFKTAQKVSVDGVDSWTTGNDGGLTIDGLRYSNWADGAAVTDSDSSKYLHYWLKEVEPAEGYNTLAQPVHFTVEKQKAEAETAVINIENTKVSNTSNLPLTGAYGAAALMIGGLLMVAGATVWYGRRRSVKA